MSSTTTRSLSGVPAVSHASAEIVAAGEGDDRKLEGAVEPQSSLRRGTRVAPVASPRGENARGPVRAAWEASTTDGGDAGLARAASARRRGMMFKAAGGRRMRAPG